MYVYSAKALVITPKNESELKFVSQLLKKLGVGLAAITQGELEDIGLSRMMLDFDKTKKVSRAEVMKKLAD
ncbi:MAG: hypothetical protein ABI378_08000 [Chitinophagaceae bacterium]